MKMINYESIINYFINKKKWIIITKLLIKIINYEMINCEMIIKYSIS